MDRSALLRAAGVAGSRTRDARRSLQHIAPSAQSQLAAEPDDLVTRALAILTESSDQAQFPRAASIAGETASQSLDLKLQQRVLSDGTKCPLPIRYFDVQCLVATFLTDLDRAAELLKGTALEAVSQEDGKAVVLVYCIEYRITDIGPYNEVGLTVLAGAPGDPFPANYVVDLPVTTAVANRAGREIWGYNKFVAAIDVNSDGKKFSTILRDTENKMICTLEGERGASIPAPPADILTFTLLEGRLIKTVIRVLTPVQASSGDSFRFKIGTSRHPMTNHLRAVDLDGASPVLVQYADPFQALLFPGRAL
jgi:hypothetical protein